MIQYFLKIKIENIKNYFQMVIYGIQEDEKKKIKIKKLKFIKFHIYKKSSYPHIHNRIKMTNSKHFGPGYITLQKGNIFCPIFHRLFKK